MAGFSNYGENIVLNWMLTTGAVTRPAAWFLALYTVAPGAGGGGSEVSGGSYARAPIALSVSGASPTLATNAAAIEYAPATGTWGTVVAVGVFDAASAGNLLAFGDLTAPKAIGPGDVLRIPVGDLDITLD